MRRPTIKRLPLWVWAVWLTLVALSFAALETIGLATTADGDTLSEATRRWLGIDPVQPWRIAGSLGFAAALLGFTAWFLPHIVFRWGWWQPFKRKGDKPTATERVGCTQCGKPFSDPACGPAHILIASERGLYTEPPAYPPVETPKSPQVSDTHQEAE